MIGAQDLHETTHAWVSASGGAVVGQRAIGGVVLIQIRGRLDEAALQPCRAALDAALARRAPLVIDLEQLAPPTAVTVALLNLMRRYVAARGGTLTFRTVPEPVLSAFKEAGVQNACRLAENVTTVIDLRGVARSDQPERAGRPIDGGGAVLAGGDA
jgi:anti-anti-sigma regulatory factor